jgi:hypothetical protein
MAQWPEWTVVMISELESGGFRVFTSHKPPEGVPVRLYPEPTHHHSISVIRVVFMLSTLLVSPPRQQLSERAG